MAHKKAGGSTSYGRDSHGQRLGVKKFAGQLAKVGNIIIRQRGSKFRAGTNVGQGTDDTLFALKDGVIKFTNKRIKRFTGHFMNARYVHVVTPDAATATSAPAKKTKSAAKAK